MAEPSRFGSVATRAATSVVCLSTSGLAMPAVMGWLSSGNCVSTFFLQHYTD